MFSVGGLTPRRLILIKSNSKQVKGEGVIISSLPLLPPALKMDITVIFRLPTRCHWWKLQVVVLVKLTEKQNMCNWSRSIGAINSAERCRPVLGLVRFKISYVTTPFLMKIIWWIFWKQHTLKWCLRLPFYHDMLRGAFFITTT